MAQETLPSLSRAPQFWLVSWSSDCLIKPHCNTLTEKRQREERAKTLSLPLPEVVPRFIFSLSFIHPFSTKFQRSWCMCFFIQASWPQSRSKGFSFASDFCFRGRSVTLCLGNTFTNVFSFPLAWEKQAAGLTGQQAALNNCLLHPKKSRVLRWHFRAGGRHQGVVQLKALFCFLWGHVNGKTLIFAFPFPFGPHCLRAQSGDNFAAHLCLLWVSALLAVCCAFPFLALAQWEGKAG